MNQYLATWRCGKQTYRTPIQARSKHDAQRQLVNWHWARLPGRPKKLVRLEWLPPVVRTGKAVAV